VKRDIVRLLHGDEEAERDRILDVHVGLERFERGRTAPPDPAGMLAQHRELLEDDQLIGQGVDPRRRRRNSRAARSKASAMSA
jgi:hypothetical protein